VDLITALFDSVDAAGVQNASVLDDWPLDGRLNTRHRRRSRREKRGRLPGN
jgi:hypothetical protein